MIENTTEIVMPLCNLSNFSTVFGCGPFFPVNVDWK